VNSKPEINPIHLIIFCILAWQIIILRKRLVAK
jgi:hypothetical protein